MQSCDSLKPSLVRILQELYSRLLDESTATTIAPPIHHTEKQQNQCNQTIAGSGPRSAPCMTLGSRGLGGDGGRGGQTRALGGDECPGPRGRAVLTIDSSNKLSISIIVIIISSIITLFHCYIIAIVMCIDIVISMIAISIIIISSSSSSNTW